jgi:hypothetical protein
MGDLLNQSNLARALGITSAAVGQAVKRGKITPTVILEDGRKLFDLDDVRLEWTPGSAGREGVKEPAPAPYMAAPVTAATPDEELSDVQRYNRARANKEEAVAQQELLSVGKMRSNLLPREEVALAFTQFLRSASQSLSGLPAKLLSRFPGLSTDGREFLTAEIRAVLDDLAMWEPGK